MNRKFTRQVGSLSEIFEFAESFFVRRKIDLQHLPAAALALEELFVNMVKHNPGNTNDILVSLDTVGERLTMSLTDFDVEPFDVTQVRAAPVDLPLEERRPGGLGIHLVRKFMDTIDYEYKERQSKVTVTKALG